MFRLDPKQAVLDHVAAQGAASQVPIVLSDAAERIVRAPSERTYSGAVIVGVAQLIEALLLATLGLAIFGAYIGNSEAYFYASLIVGAVIASNVLFNAARTHRIPAYRTIVDQSGRVLAAWSAVITTIIYFFGNEVLPEFMVPTRRL